METISIAAIGLWRLESGVDGSDFVSVLIRDSFREEGELRFRKDTRHDLSK